MADQGIVWKEEIKRQAGKLTRAVLDKLRTVERSSFRDISGADRKAITETVVNEVTGAMLRLGTFLTAGGSESVACNLDQYVNKGGKPLKITLLAEPTPENIQALGENAGKDVTISFVNKLAYEQGRDELMKAVHRDQMDWLETKDPELFPTGPQPVEAAIAALDTPAESNPMADLKEDGEWTGDDLSTAPTPLLGGGDDDPVLEGICIEVICELPAIEGSKFCEEHAAFFGEVQALRGADDKVDGERRTWDTPIGDGTLGLEDSGELEDDDEEEEPEQEQDDDDDAAHRD